MENLLPLIRDLKQIANSVPDEIADGKPYRQAFSQDLKDKLVLLVKKTSELNAMHRVERKSLFALQPTSES